jgi:carbohydrate-selective porin OprB
MRGWRGSFRATLAWTGLLLPSVESAAELIAAGSPARAGSKDPRAEAWHERDYLTGDSFGVRERWMNRGVTWHGEWIGEAWANLAGGLSEGVAAEGLAQLNLDLDLQRLVGWQGGQIRLGAIFPHGTGPTAELTGDLQGLSNIDTFRDEVAPYEMWWQQDFGKGTWNLRSGLLTADEEFAFTDGGGSLFELGVRLASGSRPQHRQHRSGLLSVGAWRSPPASR